MKRSREAAACRSPRERLCAVKCHADMQWKSVKATPHNSGAQIAQSEFSSDCLKIAGNTSCIGQDFRAI